MQTIENIQFIHSIRISFTIRTTLNLISSKVHNLSNFSPISLILVISIFIFSSPLNDKPPS